jgi:hypothetical protein
VRQFDCVVNGDVVATQTAMPKESSVVFSDLAPVEKLIEIYLTQKAAVQVTGVQLAEGASFSTLEPDRLRWVTYGSSITECAAASSPAFTWPAIVARRNQLELTCLGYSGNCHIEPMVARMIRDLPADLISVCLGINVMNQSSLSARTFRTVVLPLTMPGVAAGAVLVMIPSIGLFYVADLLGGAKSVLIGNLIQQQFTSAGDWPFGSAATIILSALTLVLIFIYVKGGGKEEELL